MSVLLCKVTHVICYSYIEYAQSRWTSLVDTRYQTPSSLAAISDIDTFDSVNSLFWKTINKLFICIFYINSILKSRKLVGEVLYFLLPNWANIMSNGVGIVSHPL